MTNILARLWAWIASFSAKKTVQLIPPPNVSAREYLLAWIAFDQELRELSRGLVSVTLRVEGANVSAYPAATLQGKVTRTGHLRFVLFGYGDTELTRFSGGNVGVLARMPHVEVFEGYNLNLLWENYVVRFPLEETKELTS